MPNGRNIAPIRSNQTSSRSASVASLSARSRPLRPSAHASRRVASTKNTRSVAASATMTPDGHAPPFSSCIAAIRSRSRLPANSASANSTSSSAGSAMAASSSVRLAATPPVAVPVSMAPSASEIRASASRPAIASRSANRANAIPRVKDGTSDAATAVAAAQTTGASTLTREAPSVSTAGWRSSRPSSCHGCSRGGPTRPATRASSHRRTPPSVGAAAAINAMCSSCARRGGRAASWRHPGGDPVQGGITPPAQPVGRVDPQRRAAERLQRPTEGRRAELRGRVAERQP